MSQEPLRIPLVSLGEPEAGRPPAATNTQRMKTWRLADYAVRLFLRGAKQACVRPEENTALLTFTGKMADCYSNYSWNKAEDEPASTVSA